MKAADIPDGAVIGILAMMPWRQDSDRMESLTYSQMEEILTQYPKKILRAKLQQMRNKGRISGDVNGCGTFYLNAVQFAAIAEAE